MQLQPPRSKEKYLDPSVGRNGDALKHLENKNLFY